LFYFGNVAQVDRRTVLVPSDDQIAITFRLVDLPVRLKDERAMRAIELACAGVNVPALNRVARSSMVNPRAKPAPPDRL
jgi:hypothetical protein